MANFLICAVGTRILLHFSYAAWMVGDSTSYTGPALAFLGQGGGYDCVRTPLYPLFLAFISWITHLHIMNGAQIDPVYANCVIIVQSVLGVIAVFYVYQILKLLKISSLICFLGTLLYNIAVPIIEYEVMILPDLLSTFMVVLSVYFFVKTLTLLRDKNQRTAAFAGLINGLAALVRPNNKIYCVKISLFAA